MSKQSVPTKQDENVKKTQVGTQKLRQETSQGLKILASKQFENRMMRRKGEWRRKYKNKEI